MSSIGRETIRALVRSELEKRLGSRIERTRDGCPNVDHPAHREMFQEKGRGEDPGLSTEKPCLIEPHRPCSNSGYCKKLGF